MTTFFKKYLSIIDLHPSAESPAFNATTPTTGAYEEELTEYERTGTIKTVDFSSSRKIKQKNMLTALIYCCKQRFIN